MSEVGASRVASEPVARVEWSHVERERVRETNGLGAAPAGSRAQFGGAQGGDGLKTANKSAQRVC